MRKILLTILSVISLLQVLSFNAKAETPGTQGITLSPIFIELALLPGEKETVTLTVSNNQDEEINCDVSLSELRRVDGGEGYELIVSSDEENDIVNLPVKHFSIPPKSSFSLPAEISMPSNPEDASFYPVIEVGATPSGVKDFSSLGKAGSIVFLNLKDNDADGKIYNMDVNPYLKIELDVKRKIVAFPFNEFNVKIENTGRTYVKPFGNLTVLNPTNVKLKDIPVNQKLKILLPGQILESDFDWEEYEGKSIWGYLIPRFGKYTVAFGVDDRKGVSSISETFWVIPIYHIILLLLILFIIAVKIWNKQSKHRRKS